MGVSYSLIFVFPVTSTSHREHVWEYIYIHTDLLLILLSIIRLRDEIDFLRRGNGFAFVPSILSQSGPLISLASIIKRVLCFQWDNSEFNAFLVTWIALPGAAGRDHRPWKSLTELKAGNNCAHLYLLKVTVFTEGEPPVDRGITFWEHSTLKGNIKTLINVKVNGYLPGFKAWEIFQKVGLVVKLLIPSFWSFLSLGALVIKVKAPVTVTSVATNDEGKGRLWATQGTIIHLSGIELQLGIQSELQRGFLIRQRWYQKAALEVSRLKWHRT